MLGPQAIEANNIEFISIDHIACRFALRRMEGSKVEIPLSPFCYSDNLILRLAKAAGEVLGKTHDELMYAFGVYMVKRIGNYGYERILKVFSFSNTQQLSLMRSSDI